MILFFKKAFSWIKKHWKWIVGSLAILISFILLVYTKQDSLKEMIRKSKLDLSKNKRDIEVLQAKKKVIEARVDHTEEEIVKVDKELESIEKKIVENKKAIRDLTIEEKMKKFDDLGY